MDEILILSMALCIGLAIIGYALKAWPITFISSIGWVVLACEIYEDYESFLALGLMIMIAISQVILVKDKGRYNG